MKYKGFIKKSRTMDFAALLIVFSIIQQQLPVLKEFIGENYPIVTTLIAIVIGLLRRVTTTPLGEKDDED